MTTPMCRKINALKELYRVMEAYDLRIVLDKNDDQTLLVMSNGDSESYEVLYESEDHDIDSADINRTLDEMQVLP